MTDRPLDGKVALVTGAGQNIGRGIALTLAGDGAKVVVNGRANADAVEETVQAIRNAGGTAIGQIADATDLAALFNKGYASVAGARDDGTTGTGSFHYYGYTLEQVSETQVRLAFQRINYNCATYCSYCSYCNYCSASNCNCDCCDG